GVADRIVSIVQAAVPRMESLRASRHVLFTNQQGVAQAVCNFVKLDTLDCPEGAVLKNGFAARKLDSVIKAGRTSRRSVIAHRTWWAVIQNSDRILSERRAHVTGWPGRRTEKDGHRGAEDSDRPLDARGGYGFAWCDSGIRPTWRPEPIEIVLLQ